MLHYTFGNFCRKFSLHFARFHLPLAEIRSRKLSLDDYPSDFRWQTFYGGKMTVTKVKILRLQRMLILLGSVVYGQSSNGLYPSSAESQNQIDAVAARFKNDPPSDQTYQEYNATSAAIIATQDNLDSLKKNADHNEKIEAIFTNKLNLLSKQAESCSADFKIQVDSLSPTSTDSFPIFLQFSQEGQAFNDNLARLRSLTPPQMCKEIKALAAAGGGELKSSLEESLRSLKARLDNNQTYTSKLLELYKDRASKLQTKVQGKHATDVLAQQLPILVGIVCLFSLLILALLKWIGTENIQMELVKSGQIIQFPMVMILLVVIISLGMSDKLAESSLSALLGGVAGYVLSQGVGSMASQRSRANSTAITTNDTVPTTTIIAPPPVKGG